MRAFRALLAVAALAMPAVLPAAAGVASGSAAAAATGEIRGHVYSRATGAPLARVCVQVTGGHSDITNSKGYYRITGLPAGDYGVTFGIDDSVNCHYTSTQPYLDIAPTLWSAAGGYGPDYDTVTVRSGQVVRGISQKMRRGGHIHGRVTDADGLPVEGASVGAWQTLDGPHDACCVNYAGGAVSDANGRFTVKALPTASYNIAISKTPGYLVKTWWPSRGFQDEANDVAVRAGGNVWHIDQTLRHTSVSGSLVDENGSPRSAIYVQLYRYRPDHGFYYSSTYLSQYRVARATTQTDGSWSFADVPAGTYRIMFKSGPSFSPATFYPSASDANDGEIVTLSYGASVTGLAGTNPHDARISGTVTDADSNPVQGACVVARDLAHPHSEGSLGSTTTAADGSYQVHSLAAGDYTVQIRDCTGTSYGTIYHGGARTPDTATQVHVAAGQFVDAGTDVLPAGGAITGAVSNGNGLTRVVATSPTGVTTTTTSATDGSYTLRGLTSGDWTVRFDGCSAGNSVVTEWWNNAHSQQGADPVTVGDGATTSGVNATLEPVSTQHPCDPLQPVGNLTATPNSTHSVLLTWTTPGGNQLPVDLDVAIQGGPVASSFALSWDSTKATMGGLVPGESYTFTVKSENRMRNGVTATSNTVVMPIGP